MNIFVKLYFITAFLGVCSCHRNHYIAPSVTRSTPAAEMSQDDALIQEGTQYLQVNYRDESAGVVSDGRESLRGGMLTSSSDEGNGHGIVGSNGVLQGVEGDRNGVYYDFGDKEVGKVNGNENLNGGGVVDINGSENVILRENGQTNEGDLKDMVDGNNANRHRNGDTLVNEDEHENAFIFNRNSNDNIDGDSNINNNESENKHTDSFDTTHDHVTQTENKNMIKINENVAEGVALENESEDEDIALTDENQLPNETNSENNNTLTLDDQIRTASTTLDHILNESLSTKDDFGVVNPNTEFERGGSGDDLSTPSNEGKLLNTDRRINEMPFNIHHTSDNQTPNSNQNFVNETPSSLIVPTPEENENLFNQNLVNQNNENNNNKNNNNENLFNQNNNTNENNNNNNNINNNNENTINENNNSNEHDTPVDLIATNTAINERTFNEQDNPEDPFVALARAIPGQGIPVQDYPVLNSIPDTDFSCFTDTMRQPGYYADTHSQSRCQVFHICQANGQNDSFLCPNGTLFRQEYFVCDWWQNVDCEKSEEFYSLNENIGKWTTSTTELGEDNGEVPVDRTVEESEDQLVLVDGFVDGDIGGDDGEGGRLSGDTVHQMIRNEGSLGDQLDLESGLILDDGSDHLTNGDANIPEDVASNSYIDVFSNGDAKERSQHQRKDASSIGQE